MLYVLHVPRSGGTAVYQSSLRTGLRQHPRVRNGNPVGADGNLLRYWEWPAARQERLFRPLGVIFNETCLGDYFEPDKHQYFVLTRDPVERCISHAAQTVLFFRHETDPAKLVDFLRTSSHPWLQNNITRMLLPLADHLNPTITEEMFQVAAGRFARMTPIEVGSTLPGWPKPKRRVHRRGAFHAVTAATLPADVRQRLEDLNALDYRLLNSAASVKQHGRPRAGDLLGAEVGDGEAGGAVGGARSGAAAARAGGES